MLQSFCHLFLECHRTLVPLTHHSPPPTPRRLFDHALGSMPRLANMASLAAFGSLAGVDRHKILYVSLMMGFVREGSAGQPFPTGLPTETTTLDLDRLDYTGTLPTQVSEGGGCFSM